MAGLQDFSYDPIPQGDQLLNRIMSPYNAVQSGFNDILRDKINTLKQRYNEEALSDFTQSNLLDRMKKQQDLDIHDYKTDPRYKEYLTRVQKGQADLQEASGKKAQETLASNIALDNSENQYKQRRTDLQNSLIQVDDLIASQHYDETGEPASPQALAQLQQYKQRLIQQLAYDEKEQIARWRDERQKELWGERLASAEKIKASAPEKAPKLTRENLMAEYIKRANEYPKGSAEYNHYMEQADNISRQKTSEGLGTKPGAYEQKFDKKEFGMAVTPSAVQQQGATQPKSNKDALKDAFR
jgi:hypothetical protein